MTCSGSVCCCFSVVLAHAALHPGRQQFFDGDRWFAGGLAGVPQPHSTGNTRLAVVAAAPWLISPPMVTPASCPAFPLASGGFSASFLSSAVISRSPSCPCVSPNLLTVLGLNWLARTTANAKLNHPPNSSPRSLKTMTKPPKPQQRRAAQLGCCGRRAALTIFPLLFRSREYAGSDASQRRSKTPAQTYEAWLFEPLLELAQLGEREPALFPSQQPWSRWIGYVIWVSIGAAAKAEPDRFGLQVHVLPSQR